MCGRVMLLFVNAQYHTGVLRKIILSFIKPIIAKLIHNNQGDYDTSRRVGYKDSLDAHSLSGFIYFSNFVLFICLS